MKHTTTINYPDFSLSVDWTGEAPEKETGFNGSFQIEKVTFCKEHPDSRETADVTELFIEFDLMPRIEDKVNEDFDDRDQLGELFRDFNDIFSPKH